VSGKSKPAVPQRPAPPEAQYKLVGVNVLGPFDRRPRIGPWSKRNEGYGPLGDAVRRLIGRGA
jgi:hypothetical protein